MSFDYTVLTTSSCFQAIVNSNSPPSVTPGISFEQFKQAVKLGGGKKFEKALTAKVINSIRRNPIIIITSASQSEVYFQ